MYPNSRLLYCLLCITPLNFQQFTSFSDSLWGPLYGVEDGFYLLTASRPSKKVLILYKNCDF